MIHPMNDATEDLTEGQSATEAAIAEILKRNAPAGSPLGAPDYDAAEARLREIMLPARLTPLA